MGHGITVECGNCHKSKEYILGVGMAFDSLQNVTSSLRYPELREVEEIVNNHSVKQTNFFHELYLCEKCYRIYARFHARIDYDEDKSYITEYECSKCGELLKSISEERIPSIPCANCGKKALKFRLTLLWD
jgi:DNA-directed RNA polymerase subunit RPC12/RpoP